METYPRIHGVLPLVVWLASGLFAYSQAPKVLRPMILPFFRKISSPSRSVEAYRSWWFSNFDPEPAKVQWLGVPAWKSPLDFWMYQEIIYETKPDVIIDSGTFTGGSALFFASMCDLMKRGRVLSIDILEFPGRPKHERITYLLGSSTSDEVFAKIKEAIGPGDRVMASLDSDHHAAHVLAELRRYGGLVTVGNYLVVEDTYLAQVGRLTDYRPGPAEAVQEFLKDNPNYVQDKSREKFGATMFPGGWLKRIR